MPSIRVSEWMYSSIVVNINTKWRSVVSFELWPLYPLCTKLGGPPETGKYVTEKLKM